VSILWPATLHHLARSSPEPERLARFYAELLGDRVEALPGGRWLVSGPGRRLVTERGAKGQVPYFGLQMKDAAHLASYRQGLEQRGLACAKLESPLFGKDAFSIGDPDARRIVFGISPEKPETGTTARLQHFVCASTRLEEMLGFYRDSLGMHESDRVLEGEALAAVFLRSDPEHHSFAAFRAPESRADHHCYETRSWNDIRDWADRMASLRIPLWWGPGRHGPGNNLFFMIEDPEGHKVEFSAEIERIGPEVPYRTWPHEQRTLNLWGSAWMRS
jgi:catechol 2,3-dioxygenase-like lactoylglutathione lyase family enzyme